MLICTITITAYFGFNTNHGSAHMKHSSLSFFLSLEHERSWFPVHFSAEISVYTGNTGDFKPCVTVLEKHFHLRSILLARHNHKVQILFELGSHFVAPTRHTHTHFRASSLDENNEAVWCETTMGRNERSRLFRTHESSSVHLDHERPLRHRTETPWRSADFMKGYRI